MDTRQGAVAHTENSGLWHCNQRIFEITGKNAGIAITLGQFWGLYLVGQHVAPIIVKFCTVEGTFARP